MTGPHGTFVVEQLTARHTVEWHGRSFTIYRDCVVRTSDGVRRVYGIPVDMLDES